MLKRVKHIDWESIYQICNFVAHGGTELVGKRTEKTLILLSCFDAFIVKFELKMKTNKLVHSQC